MDAARALVQKEDTDLTKRIRAELDKHEGTFSAAGKSYSVIQRLSHRCDWFEIFEVQDKERGSCCVCGGPAHNPHSGYCQSKSLRYIKECLSGLLGTPEVIRGTELRMGTTKPNASAWAALVDAGCQQGEGILPLYTACAWGDTGRQIMKWNVGHVCQSKEYGFLAQMKSSDLSEMPAERASVATEDMYMMRELELGDKTEIPWMVSLAYDLCDEECITQIVQEEQRTPKGRCRGEVVRRIYHDSPLRTFDIGQTAMLTLHAVPEAGGTQSVSYGGAGMNASEGMHHKDAVINVGRHRPRGGTNGELTQVRLTSLFVL
jgi:hypothetical protein